MAKSTEETVFILGTFALLFLVMHGITSATSGATTPFTGPIPAGWILDPTGRYLIPDPNFTGPVR